MPDFPTNLLAGHVPAGLCYGPVVSRRFGRSLGVSLSEPDQWACAWRCPYCQQGHLPRVAAYADPAAIIAAVTIALAAAEPDTIDCLTIAGGGEPSDHPDFPALAGELAALAHASGLRCILLTNGDGLPEYLDGIDALYVKWDPGPTGGSWPGRGLRAAAARRERLRALPGLRIQAMGFHPARSAWEHVESWRSQWLDDLVALRPIEVHLTTIERPAVSTGVQPWHAARLSAWAEAAERHLGGVPVRAFPSRTQTDPIPSLRGQEET